MRLIERLFGKKIFRKSRLALKYCRGAGIEIGGSAHNPFGLKTLNVDFTDSMETSFKKDEIELCGRALPVDIVAPGDALPLPDGSTDFVVSSHVLEHFTDPIKALLEWWRVLKVGGVIFAIVPHKERTFDKPRPRTTLQHLIDDHHNPNLQPSDCPGGHEHVWILDDIVELLEWTMKEYPAGFSGEIVDTMDPDDKVGNGFTIVFRKS